MLSRLFHAAHNTGVGQTGNTQSAQQTGQTGSNSSPRGAHYMSQATSYGARLNDYLQNLSKKLSNGYKLPSLNGQRSPSAHSTPESASQSGRTYAPPNSPPPPQHSAAPIYPPPGYQSSSPAAQGTASTSTHAPAGDPATHSAKPHKNSFGLGSSVFGSLAGGFALGSLMSAGSLFAGSLMSSAMLGGYGGHGGFGVMDNLLGAGIGGAIGSRFGVGGALAGAGIGAIAGEMLNPFDNIGCGFGGFGGDGIADNLAGAAIGGAFGGWKGAAVGSVLGEFLF